MPLLVPSTLRLVFNTAAVRPPSKSANSLDEDIANRLSRDARQPNIQTLKFNGEFGVFDAKQAQHGRVQIVHVHNLINRGVAQFIGRAVHEARLDAAATEPNAETG